MNVIGRPFFVIALTIVLATFFSAAGGFCFEVLVAKIKRRARSWIRKRVRTMARSIHMARLCARQVNLNSVGMAPGWLALEIVQIWPTVLF